MIAASAELSAKKFDAMVTCTGHWSRSTCSGTGSGVPTTAKSGASKFTSKGYRVADPSAGGCEEGFRPEVLMTLCVFGCGPPVVPMAFDVH